jgi:hypothetical protein
MLIQPKLANALKDPSVPAEAQGELQLVILLLVMLMLP